MISVNHLNIYDQILSVDDQEFIDILLRSAGLGESVNLRIERIVSNGKVSPANFWYDQDFNEWCCLIRGRAVLQTKSNDMLIMQEGDSCFFSKHQVHRVLDVSEDAIWITVCWD